MDGQTVSYGALSLLPAVLAIALAIWKRQVIVSLLFGIWVGATIINGYNPITGLLDTFSKYVVEKSLADSWNAGIIIFCLAIGGLVGVITKMGGMQAIADALVKKAKGVKSTMLMTGLMGIAIFFDDYANSMIVGNSMRPLTDSKNISREKLAYIVDSTAAPVSSMAPLSTWIAMELGLIAQGLKDVNIDASPMMVFLQSVPFKFYSLLALGMVFFLIWQGRDFGPMLKAELRARKEGKVYGSDSEPLVADDKDLLPAEGVTPSVWDAILPIGLFVLVTIFGLWYNGGGMDGKTVRGAYGDADASVVLTWAAFISGAFGIVLGLAKGKFKLTKAVDSWVSGAKSMLVAVFILILAFALKAVITDMDLAGWLVGSATGLLHGSLLPTFTFLVAMIVAFSTGTSWGTDAILMPIAIPLAAAVSGATDAVTPVMFATIGAVLTGAVFGDHCSPISDTTILSSLASGSDHIDHVRTQAPYAITAAIIGIVVGFIPVGLGVPVWLCLIVGFALLFVFIRFFGTQVDAA